MRKEKVQLVAAGALDETVHEPRYEVHNNRHGDDLPCVQPWYANGRGHGCTKSDSFQCTVGADFLGPLPVTSRLMRVFS